MSMRKQYMSDRCIHHARDCINLNDIFCNFRNTYRDAKHALEFKPLASMMVKGKENPIEVYMPNGTVINAVNAEPELVSYTTEMHVGRVQRTHCLTAFGGVAGRCGVCSGHCFHGPDGHARTSCRKLLNHPWHISNSNNLFDRRWTMTCRADPSSHMSGQ